MKQHFEMRQAVQKELIKGNVKGEFIPFQTIWVRIFHWGFAVTLTVVLLTSLELHKPASFLALNYGRVLEVHLICVWFAMGFLAIRIADAIIRRDDSLLPKWREIKLFPKLLAYYLFLRPFPPPSKKYNSGQLIIYFSWLLVFLFASLLGFTSYWQGEHLIWVWRLVGGFQILRWIKFTASIYFLATIPVHVYLSLTEDISRLQAMITGYERKLQPKKN